MSIERVVFLVTGDCGEYDDARSWPVRVLENRADADALMAKLRAWCEEHICDYDRALDGSRVEIPWKPGPAAERWVDCLRAGVLLAPPEDPNFRTHPTTGTRYTVTEIPFTAAKRETTP